MKKVIIAPVGKNVEALFLGLREFSTEKVYLIATQDRTALAKKIQKDLQRFKIQSKIFIVKGDAWEGTFTAISEIKNIEKDSEVIINVATADSYELCAATCAAFVNGLKAFGVAGNEIMMLPVMRFSYYKMITDKKFALLKIFAKDKKCCGSLEELSKKAKMSLPLVSYHINGNLKSEGLKQMGLVETKEEKGRVSVELTTLGRLMVRGYV